jgi:hypothetical protein
MSVLGDGMGWVGWVMKVWLWATGRAAEGGVRGEDSIGSKSIVAS